MTEPKVVHEWMNCGIKHFVDGTGWMWMQGEDPAHDGRVSDTYKELSRLAAENTRLRKTLDQYREDADEWKCPTCGEWQRPWQMYCDKDECRAALKEKP